MQKVFKFCKDHAFHEIPTHTNAAMYSIVAVNNFWQLLFSRILSFSDGCYSTG